LEEAAERLPVRVKGDVAWVALRIDPTHIRPVIIDPGYLDPDDREAEFIFQLVEAMESNDILSGENLPIIIGKMSFKVPLGILRVIDIKHNYTVKISLTAFLPDTSTAAITYSFPETSVSKVKGFSLLTCGKCLISLIFLPSLRIS